MAKTKYKSVWMCNSCGATFPKWEGRCSECGEWNTMVEQRVSTSTRADRGLTGTEGARPVAVSDITAGSESRIPMPSRELNRVLGGGLVAGSMVLIGGEPGIGKSTLVLQNSPRLCYMSRVKKVRPKSRCVPTV